jgi:predicted ArsR family transcriptional regulator
MAKAKRTITQSVLGALSTKENRSVAAIAKRAGVDVQTTRMVLNVAAELGAALVSGKKETGKRGRPALLYRKPEATA